jgi:hypothetical protein
MCKGLAELLLSRKRQLHAIQYPTGNHSTSARKAEMTSRGLIVLAWLAALVYASTGQVRTQAVGGASGVCPAASDAAGWAGMAIGMFDSGAGGLDSNAGQRLRRNVPHVWRLMEEFQSTLRP